LALKLSIHSDTKAEMKNKLKYALFSVLTFLLAATHVYAAAPHYFRTAVACPRGTTSGWIISPTETPALYRQAALFVGDPKNSWDGRSGLYFVDNRSPSISITASEKYSEAIGAVKGDMDGDGVVDALIWYRSRQYFRILYGDRPPRAAGRFYEDTLRLGSPDTLALADLNNDGLPEILAWHSASALHSIHVLWQENTSAGSDRFKRFDNYYLPPPSTSSSPNYPGFSPRFLFGDFNADGVKDFIFREYLFIGDSQGKFTRKPFLVRENISSSLGAFDLDGDGQTELIVSQNDAANKKDMALICDLNSDSVFTASESFPLNLQGAVYCDFTDFNNDGFSDLVFGGNGTITVRKGSAKGLLAAGGADTLVAGTRGLTSLGATDWGNDGILDWLFLTSRADSLVIYSPSDARYLDNTAKVGLDRSMAGNAVAVADYNNDGLPDIFILNGKGYSALFQGQADGRFIDMAQQAGVAQVNYGISCAWGDYDNDGFQDLFIAGFTPQPCKLYRNNGDGTFADSSRIIGLDQTGQQRATSVCWGDVNRDGWLDLLVGNYDGANWLLLNQNGRKFIDRSKEYGLTESYKTESANLVDVDADGWLDIVTLNDEGPVRLLTGSEKGFNDATASSGLNSGQTYAKFGQSQSWGDFNGDGYPDLYITRAQDVDALYLNNGKSGVTRFDRKFSDIIDGSKYGRLASAIADLDEDTRPDLLIARASKFGRFSASSTDLFFSNSGQYPNPAAGVKAADETGLRRAADSSLPVPGDFDGDGDLDILYVNYLPDNPDDLFHGVQSPLGYSENKGLSQRNLAVRLKRDKNRSAIGTKILLAAGGKIWLQTVSGGGGRIQTGGPLIWSLIQSSFADSLVVIWPNRTRQTLRGPILAGSIEVTEDQSGPAIRFPQPPDGTINSTLQTMDVNLEVSDINLVNWVRIVFSDSDTTRADTVYGQQQGGDIWKITRRTPLPGKTQSFFFEACDSYNFISRSPSTGYYSLFNTATRFVGDINFDNKVNVFDLIRLLAIIGGSGPVPSVEEKAAADVNQDGRVTDLDMFPLLKLINN